MKQYTLAILAALLAAVGCGGPYSAQVHGTVMLDNQPLTSGTVTFHPAGGKGATPYSQIDAAGRYELQTGAVVGLAPGSYIATVVATAEVPPASPTEEPTFRPITPPKYGNTATSDLKFDVQAGKQEIPLTLKSK